MKNAEKVLKDMLSDGERNSTELYWITTSLSNIGASKWRSILGVESYNLLALPSSLTVSNLINLIDKEDAILRWVGDCMKNKFWFELDMDTPSLLER